MVQEFGKPATPCCRACWAILRPLAQTFKHLQNKGDRCGRWSRNYGQISETVVVEKRWASPRKNGRCQRIIEWVLSISPTLTIGSNIAGKQTLKTVVVVISSAIRRSSSGKCLGARHGPLSWAGVGALVVTCAHGMLLVNPRKSIKAAVGAIFVRLRLLLIHSFTMARAGTWKEELSSTHRPQDTELLLRKRLPARLLSNERLPARLLSNGESTGHDPMVENSRPLATENLGHPPAFATEAERIVSETASELLSDKYLLKGKVPQCQDWLDAWAESTEQVAFS